MLLRSRPWEAFEAFLLTDLVTRGEKTGAVDKKRDLLFLLLDKARDSYSGGLVRRWGGGGGGVETFPRSILKGVVIVGEQEIVLFLGFNNLLLMTVDVLGFGDWGPRMGRGMLWSPVLVVSGGAGSVESFLIGV